MFVGCGELRVRVTRTELARSHVVT
jgi:hypothetical protein